MMVIRGALLPLATNCLILPALPSQPNAPRNLHPKSTATLWGSLLRPARFQFAVRRRHQPSWSADRLVQIQVGRPQAMLAAQVFPDPARSLRPDDRTADR